VSHEDKKDILLEAGTNELEIVEFSVGGSHYGMNIAKVREIIKGEIDIVAQKSEFIVFIEVKSRIAGEKSINPLISVTRTKRNRIRRLGEIYLNHRKVEGYQPRFDVIGITFTSELQFELEHIENAF